jgi:hypothetical protein
MSKPDFADRACRVCGVVKSPEGFRKSRGWLERTCRDCRKERRAAIRNPPASGLIPCSVCKEKKPSDRFYTCPASSTGVRSACIDCVRRSRKLDPERLRESQRKARARRGAEIYAKRSAVGFKGARDQARSRFKYALKLGILTKPDACEKCGAKPERRLLHGHHADYSKPLEVEWLCTFCHGEEHRKYA